MQEEICPRDYCTACRFPFLSLPWVYVLCTCSPIMLVAKMHSDSMFLYWTSHSSEKSPSHLWISHLFQGGIWWFDGSVPANSCWHWLAAGGSPLSGFNVHKEANDHAPHVSTQWPHLLPEPPTIPEDLRGLPGAIMEAFPDKVDWTEVRDCKQKDDETPFSIFPTTFYSLSWPVYLYPCWSFSKWTATSDQHSDKKYCCGMERFHSSTFWRLQITSGDISKAQKDRKC